MILIHDPIILFIINNITSYDDFISFSLVNKKICKICNLHIKNSPNKFIKSSSDQDKLLDDGYDLLSELLKSVKRCKTCVKEGKGIFEEFNGVCIDDNIINISQQKRINKNIVIKRCIWESQKIHNYDQVNNDHNSFSYLYYGLRRHPAYFKKLKRNSNNEIICCYIEDIDRLMELINLFSVNVSIDVSFSINDLDENDFDNIDDVNEFNIYW